MLTKCGLVGFRLPYRSFVRTELVVDHLPYHFIVLHLCLLYILIIRRLLSEKFPPVLYARDLLCCFLICRLRKSTPCSFFRYTSSPGRQDGCRISITSFSHGFSRRWRTRKTLETEVFVFSGDARTTGCRPKRAHNLLKFSFD